MKSSFEEKLDKYFQKFRLSLPSKYPEHQKHLYGDYIEVIALFSNHSFVTSSDILDRFKDEGIIRQVKDASRQAEKNDENEAWISGIFRTLEDRSFLYGDTYPFEYEAGRISLREELTVPQKLYLNLLLCSNLSIFHSFEPELTSEFEMICYYALCSYLPPNSIVKSFGKNSEYDGSAVEKILKLAEHLNIGINQEYIDELSARGNQERGLDVIAWIPFGDLVPNFISVFAQCACGKEWYKKLTETRRYENYYKFYHQLPIHAFFMPYSLINYQSSKYYQADELTVKTLIFERKRIISLLSDFDFFQELASKVLVDKCIEYEEDIV